MNDAAAPPTPYAPPWIFAVLGYAALLLLPALLAVVMLGAKFQGLRLNQALEHAQVARHVAAGEGFVTDSIRPLSLGVHADLRRHPDLYHAPAHPLFLGIAYAMFEPSERLTAAAGLLLWVVSVVLTFFLARRWFDARVAALAAVLYGCNVALVKAAVFGLPHPLCAIFVLLAAWVAQPRPDADSPDPAAGGVHGVRIAAVGLLCALAAMTHYVLFFLAPAVGVFLVASRRRKGRAILFFALGFLVVAAPWMIRNTAWSRSPLFSLYWYEALAGTEAFPGESVWRSMSSASTGPGEFVLLHPLQVARKALTGLVRFWQEALPVANPVVAFLFACALLGGRIGPPLRRWLLAALAGLLCCIGASCVLRAEPELLLAWTPLMAIAGAAQAVAWVAERSERISMRPYWKLPLVRVLFGRPERARAGVQVATALALLAVAGLPLLHHLWVFRAEPHAATREAAALNRLVPPDATVMTDQPAFVAWHARRRSLWLFRDEGEWDAIEGCGGRIEATFVTPGLASLSPGEAAGWWWWITSPRGVYRDLVPVDATPSRGVLRVRGGGKG